MIPPYCRLLPAGHSDIEGSHMTHGTVKPMKKRYFSRRENNEVFINFHRIAGNIYTMILKMKILYTSVVFKYEH